MHYHTTCLDLKFCGAYLRSFCGRRVGITVLALNNGKFWSSEAYRDIMFVVNFMRIWQFKPYYAKTNVYIKF